jgi:glucose/arabinose dehydrogenase
MVKLERRGAARWLRWFFVGTMAAMACLSWLGVRAAPAGVAAGRAAQAAPWPSILLTPVTTATDRPIYITHAGDGSGRVFIVERAGRVRIWQNGALHATPFLDIGDRVSVDGECGLLSIAFPPDYATADPGYFFVFYSSKAELAPPPNAAEPNDGCDSVVARFRVTANPNVADAGSEDQILVRSQPQMNHHGGQLQFGPDGYLYISLGDGGGGGDPLNAGQRIDTWLGKILRVQVGATGDYTVPADNPFVGQPGALAEIWALGLRNPWRFSFDRTAGHLFVADVGQNAYEEVNYQPVSSSGGENYGWRIMEGTHCHQPPTGCGITGLTLPIHEYGRSQGDRSVTGGYVYRGGAYPELAGIYFFGDFASGRIFGLRRDGAGWANHTFLKSNLKIASFGEDEAGNVYVADLTGGVHRIVIAPTRFIHLPLITVR